MRSTVTILGAARSRPSRQRRARGLALPFALISVLVFGLAQAQGGIYAVLNNGSLSTQVKIVSSGFRALDLVNHSNETAVFSVYRLRNGASLTDFMGANQRLVEAGSTQAGAHEVIESLSESAAALSGVSVSKHSTKSMYLELEWGDYVIVAAPKSGGAVYTTFQVTRSSGDAATAPQVPNVVKFSDFAYDFPTKLSADVTLWKVSNTGTQPHVADLYRLLPGRTAQDLIAYLSGDGGARAPYDETASIPLVAEGETVYVPVDLEPGNWVALCFVPDMENPSLTHVMEGMVAEFRVN